MTDENARRDLRKEGLGWLSMVFIMLLFPGLFFLCVYLPLWAGWTSPW